MVAWGYNEAGQTTVPAGLSGVTAIGAGFNHSLALGTTPSETLATTTSVSPSPSSPTDTQPVTFTATVSPTPPGTGTPTGQVIFTINGTVYPAVTLVNGMAGQQAGPFAPGSVSYSAAYQGDGIYAGSNSGPGSVNVSASAATHFSVSAPSASTAGTAFSVTVTALDSTGATATGYMGTVHFTSSDAQAGLPADYTFTAGDNGIQTFPNGVTLQTGGPQSVTATDTATSSITGTANVTVSPAAATVAVTSSLNPSLYKQSVTFTATVTGNSPAGAVTFTIDGHHTKLIVLSGGMATFTTSSLSVGGHTVTAAYSGNYNNAPADSTASPLTQTVNQAQSALTVANLSGGAGQTLALSATLLTTGGAPLGGKSVTFRVNGVVVGIGVTISSGKATFNYTVPATLTVGNNYPITAAYAGDASATASAGSGTLTVNPALTAVYVTAVSGSVGQTRTLKATLKRMPGGVALSGKTLSFSVDGTPVGTAVTNSSGLASLNYAIAPGTSGGNHPLTISFAGDSANTASSGTGTLTVK